MKTSHLVLQFSSRNLNNTVLLHVPETHSMYEIKIFVIPMY
jgi:hypothetical protein